MLFNKEQKICLYEPTKTGSTTARNFLMRQGWSLLRPVHGKPPAFIGKYPNLAEYKSYVFFRNPLDRFLSIIHHVKRGAEMRYLDVFKTNENSMKTINPEGTPVQTWHDIISKIVPDADLTTSFNHFTYDDIIDNFYKFETDFQFMFDPQVHWTTAPNTEVLDFDNYEAELRRISGALDPETYPVPRLNVSEDKYKGEVTSTVIDFVQTYYADDYQFAKDVLGKDYAEGQSAKVAVSSYDADTGQSG